MLLNRFLLILNKDSESEPRGKSFLLSFTTALMIFTFLATVPLNLDRSFSVWMLNQTFESEGQLSVKELEKEASQFFAPSGGEIKRRINEQISLGNLEVINSQVELTIRGKLTWKINRIISEFFGLNEKYTG